LIAAAPAVLAGQMLSLRFGSRLGSYASGFFTLSSLRWGRLSLFSNGFWLQKSDGRRFNQISSGLSFSPGRFSFSAFLYSYAGQNQLNGSVGLNLAKTQIYISYFSSEFGNVNLYQQLPLGIILSGTANLAKGERFKGQIDLSIPININFGREKKEAGRPVYDRAKPVPVGNVEGQLIAEGEPLPGILLELAGQRAVTDDQGRFSFENVLIGKYPLRLLNLPIFYRAPELEVSIKENKTIFLNIEIFPKSDYNRVNGKATHPGRCDGDSAY